MKKLQTHLIAAIAMTASLISCSSSENALSGPVYVSNVSDAGCLPNSMAKSDAPESRGWNDGSFEMTIEGSTAKCRFSDVYYNCAFSRVDVKASYADGVLTIIEQPVHESDLFADCVCSTDVTFDVENIPDEDFMLVIYSANWKGIYDEEHPALKQHISVADKSFRFPYPTHELPEGVYIANLSDAGCLSDGQSGSNAPASRGWNDGAFEMVLDGTSAQCLFSKVFYSCNFERVNVEASYADGVLTIIEQAIYPDDTTANCICLTDVSFNIVNLPDEDFTLVIYRANEKGVYHPEQPALKKQISVADKSFRFAYPDF